jgi:hypothetical protein
MKKTVKNWMPAVAIAALAGAADGCGAESEIERQNLGLTNVQTVVTHVHHWSTGPETVVRYLVTECADGSARCDEPTKIFLQRDRNDGVPFGATAQGSYQGCGPQAVANVMGYVLGNVVSVADTKRWTETWGSGDHIGTTPDKLQHAVDMGLKVDYHQYQIVRGHDGPTLPELKRYLLTGYPLVLLVNGGDHYQMVTGYQAPDWFYVVDYAWEDTGTSYTKITSYDPTRKDLLLGQWKHFPDLRFYVLDPVPMLAFGFEGYRPKTYLAIEGFTDRTPLGGDATQGGDGSCEQWVIDQGCPGGVFNATSCSCECNPDARATCENNPRLVYDAAGCFCTVRDTDA